MRCWAELERADAQSRDPRAVTILTEGRLDDEPRQIARNEGQPRDKFGGAVSDDDLRWLATVAPSDGTTELYAFRIGIVLQRGDAAFEFLTEPIRGTERTDTRRSIHEVWVLKRARVTAVVCPLTAVLLQRAVTATHRQRRRRFIERICHGPMQDRRLEIARKPELFAIGSCPRRIDVTYSLGQVFWLPNHPPQAPSHPTGQWSYLVRPRIQRRDRAGMTPASLLGPKLGHLRRRD